jgi:hypothetical protein
MEEVDGSNPSRSTKKIKKLYGKKERVPALYGLASRGWNFPGFESNNSGRLEPPRMLYLAQLIDKLFDES